MSILTYNLEDQIVVFTLDEQSFALSLSEVVKVIHAIEIKRLPGSPEIITGIINYKGRIIPVADIRKRLGMQSREIDPDYRMIVTDSGNREIAFLADSVTGTRTIEPLQLSYSRETSSIAEQIKGVSKLEDGLVLIYNLERFLSSDEEAELEIALKTQKNEL